MNLFNGKLIFSPIDPGSWAESNVEKVGQNLGLNRWQSVAAVIGE